MSFQFLIGRASTKLSIHVCIAYEWFQFLIGRASTAFQFVGINLSGLAVIFGLLSVGIGFGLQNVTSNFIAGLILLFEQPIKIGDRIMVGDTEGDVLEINIRSTTIRSLNNVSIIVPNSEFVSSNVVNWSHGDPKIRLVVEVGVSYQSDLDTVLRSLQEVHFHLSPTQEPLAISNSASPDQELDYRDHIPALYQPLPDYPYLFLQY